MKKLMVFTDLDGTLLDHKNYSWQTALHAIKKLHALNFPLIFNSSKTYSEMIQLSEQMNNHHPFIFENGSSIAIPHKYFTHRIQEQNEIIHFGESYQTILEILTKLRKRYQYKFIGFNDASVEDIMAMTNLDKNHAFLAKQRQSSEPIKWLDSDSVLKDFKARLRENHLTLIKGGRFYNVMGQCSKGEAIFWLLKQYQQAEPETDWITVALGDSPNDIPMLESVAYPILISNPDISAPDIKKLKNITTPRQPGPEGWNKAIHDLINLIQ